jgi:hypothetical protein
VRRGSGLARGITGSGRPRSSRASGSAVHTAGLASASLVWTRAMKGLLCAQRAPPRDRPISSHRRTRLRQPIHLAGAQPPHNRFHLSPPGFVGCADARRRIDRRITTRRCYDTTRLARRTPLDRRPTTHLPAGTPTPFTTPPTNTPRWRSTHPTTDSTPATRIRRMCRRQEAHRSAGHNAPLGRHNPAGPAHPTTDSTPSPPGFVGCADASRRIVLVNNNGALIWIRQHS